VTWLLLTGIFTPAAITIYLGGAKFTPGRIVMSLLLFTALPELLQKRRHLVAADFFALAASVWMIGAILQTDPESLSSTAAIVLEFAGGYIIARAYFVGRPALEALLQALKIIAIVVIGLALLEHLTGRIVVYNSIAALWGLPTLVHEYRYGMPRAFSTFPHPILYGTFCVIGGAIFLYCGRTLMNRLFYGGLCFFGCVLAVSSAPLISFMVVLAIYSYDQLLQRYSWRWRALATGACALLAVVFLVANKPISWIIANLTLDPSTGYFRVATWDSAFYYIGLSPWLGYGFQAYAGREDFFANASVDSVWLVMALRFGVPLIIFMILLNVTAFYPFRARARMRAGDQRTNEMRTAFTLALFIFMFTGLTVHYWNNLWIIWGVCVGIRAGFQESDLGAAGCADRDNVWKSSVAVRQKERLANSS
jgi:O-antigen ligase